MAITHDDIPVTPDMAKVWLVDHNPSNRRLSLETVTKYAEDMVHGRWQYTGDPIQFDAEGDMLNGQHRMQAVVNSGCTVTFHVIKGLPVSARKYMDTGRKRTVGDVLNIEGNSNGKLMGAVMRTALDVDVYRQTNGESRGLRMISSAEIVERIEEDEHIGWVCAISTEWPHKLINRTAAAYCYWTLHKIEPYQTAEFFKLLVTPANIDERSPIMALHKRLSMGNWNEYKGRDLKFAQIACVFLAWNAWRNDEKRIQIKVPKFTSNGRISIPEPV